MASDLIQVKWETRRKVLFKDLSSLRNKQIHTDITLLCDGESYPAHRLILTMTSGYFERMLQTNLEQLSPSLVLICGIRAPVLQALLNFIYDGMTTIKGEDIPNLLQAGIMFEIPGLMEMGNDFIAPRGTSDDSTIGYAKTSFTPFKLSSTSTSPLKEKDVKANQVLNSSEPENPLSVSTSEEDSGQKEFVHVSQNQDKEGCGDEDGGYYNKINRNAASATTAQLLFSDHSNSEEEELFEGWEVPHQVTKKKGSTKGYKRSHRCPICGRSFFKKESLSLHLKDHNKTSTTFHCNQCGRIFNNQRIYKSHLRKCSCITGRSKLTSGKREAPEQSLQSKKCSKKRSDSGDPSIESVLKSVSKSFSDRSRQKKHFLVPDDSIYDEEVKSSELAGAFPRPRLPASPQKGSVCEPLRDGLELEHSVASIRTKECNFCHVTFPDNRGYKKHRTSDCVVLECPYCLNDFKKDERMEYRDHVNTHRHSENPYTCPKCSFSTNRMRRFEDHVSIHTGVFRFSCPSCDFQTQNWNDLDSHLIEAHVGANQ